jgi:hypothetical protein
MGALKNCSESLSAQEFVATHRHLLGDGHLLAQFTGQKTTQVNGLSGQSKFTTSSPSFAWRFETLGYAPPLIVDQTSLFCR